MLTTSNFRVGLVSCLKVESYRRKQKPVITDQIEGDGRKKNYG